MNKRPLIYLELLSGILISLSNGLVATFLGNLMFTLVTRISDKPDWSQHALRAHYFIFVIVLSLSGTITLKFFRENRRIFTAINLFSFLVILFVFAYFCYLTWIGRVYVD
jgi:hypothetical protein